MQEDQDHTCSRCLTNREDKLSIPCSGIVIGGADCDDFNVELPTKIFHQGGLKAGSISQIM